MFQGSLVALFIEDELILGHWQHNTKPRGTALRIKVRSELRTGQRATVRAPHRDSAVLEKLLERRYILRFTFLYVACREAGKLSKSQYPARVEFNRPMRSFVGNVQVARVCALILHCMIVVLVWFGRHLPWDCNDDDGWAQGHSFLGQVLCGLIRNELEYTITPRV